MQKLVYSFVLYFSLIETSYAYLGPGLGLGILEEHSGLFWQLL